MPRNCRSWGTLTLSRNCSLQILQARCQPIGKHVCHGHQFDRSGGRQSLLSRTCSTPSATDQGNLDRVVFRRVAANIDGIDQGGSGQHGRRLFEKLTT